MQLNGFRHRNIQSIPIAPLRPQLLQAGGTMSLVAMDADHYRLIEQSSRLKLLGVTACALAAVLQDFSSK